MTSTSSLGGEIRVAVLFSGLFLALGMQMAFLQLWLEDWGLSAAEIGVLHSVGVATRIVAGVALPAWSDRWGRPRAALTGLALVGAAAAALHLAASGRAELYLLTMLSSAAFAGLIPMSDAHGYAAADRAGFSYRRARAVGSLAFLAATALGGAAVARYGVDVAPIWMAVALALGAIGAADAPFPSARKAAPPIWRGLWSVLSQPGFALFMLAVAGTTASHGVYYVYSSVHWRDLGFSETVIGGLWAWGVAAEIGLFMVGRSVIERLGPARALALGGAAAAFRWTAMAFEPGLAALIALQTLHALTFGLIHLAALAFIAARAPANLSATAQGVTAAAAGGVAMLLATSLAAWVYPIYGSGAYWLSAGFGVVGLVAALALAAPWSGHAPAEEA
ncbi:MAG: MFS transporter [Rhodobacteraceae bacterium]|nr:MFS transporter [Paracoccaceae bacterium]